MKSQKTIPEFIRTLPEIDLPLRGARGWLLQGPNQQVAFLEFAEAVDVPKHSHREQWEFVLAGSVVLHMNAESTRYTTGDSFFIPPGAPHGASVAAGYQAMIIFNEPDRYRAKM